MEKLSTQIDFDSLDLEKAAKVEKECFEIQNKGAEDKHRAGRRAGILLNEIEDKDGQKAKKNILPIIGISGAIAKRWQKDAEVPNTDYERYVDECHKKLKELTNSGLRRAGKENKPSKLLSTAGKILKNLSPWLNSSLIKSVARKEYVGTAEEIRQVSELLEKLSKQFLDCANQIKN